MIVAMTKPLFAWDCLEDSPAWAPSGNSSHPFPTPNSSQVFGGIAAGDATTALCMSPGACSYCGWPCDIPPSSRRWRNSAATKLSADSSASRQKKMFLALGTSRVSRMCWGRNRISPRSNASSTAWSRNWAWPCLIWAKTRRVTPRPCTPAARMRRGAQGGSRRGPTPTQRRTQGVQGRRGQGHQDLRMVRLQAAPAGGRQARGRLGL